MSARATAALNQEQDFLYSYKHVINGFAARLSEEDVEAMKEMEGFVSAHLEKVLHQQTTHTPRFLGLHQDTGLWRESNFGKGVIIGVLDGGILPTHPSFTDEGMPSPPARWKGKCEFVTSKCNNKIIGARSFNNSATIVSPFDQEGHGSHVAGIAAGRFVKNAAVLGLGNGTAVGVAPKAHLAIYKVCPTTDKCFESDLLAGIDAAVNDGVDVISISIVGKFAVPFFQDAIAVGSFAAIQKGIFVSCSAGNTGPSNSTVLNDAPWILTVGASTTDRSFKVTTKLGNGEEFAGESLFQPEGFSAVLMPLIYAGSSSNSNSSFCVEGSLEGIDVKGKIVLCERGLSTRVSKGETVRKAGGAAMILMNQEIDGSTTIAESHVLPAAHVSYATGLRIKAFINSTVEPKAAIVFKGTRSGDPLAPAVASFSARGPSITTPGILKPDIVGPGVNILSAWPFSVGGDSNSLSTFNVQSGTSMSCPHLSGIAALLKSAHPNWSPAAIKSAIMTTADLNNLNESPIVTERSVPADVFAIGAGHVNPSKANNPGLVYDIHPDEYIPYLCGLGYTNDQVGVITQRPINCTNETSIPEAQLNYPSFSITLASINQTYTRTMTNVGEPNSSYYIEIIPPKGVLVTVNPTSLDFTEANQQLTYRVTFGRSTETIYTQYAQGFLKWTSTHHTVRSPISVKLV
nr:PREDICTED: subtilisin-like protease SBT1.2 [Daucus carota subsp. sativus]